MRCAAKLVELECYATRSTFLFKEVDPTMLCTLACVFACERSATKHSDRNFFTYKVAPTYRVIYRMHAQHTRWTINKYIHHA